MKKDSIKKCIKEPIEPGNFAKVPMIMQMEALECGAACLCMVLAYYGRYESLSKIRKESGVSRDGSNLDAIVSLAETYGLEAHSYSMDSEDVKDEATSPSILFWDNNHFVVYDGYKNGKYKINNPAEGIVELSEEEFESSYSGICTTFAPTKKFVPGGVKDSIIDFLKENLSGAFPMVALVIITTLIITLVGILEPVFPRFFIDYLITGDVSKSWHKIFFTGFIIIGLIKIMVLWIRNSYLDKMEGKLAIYSSTKFLWHILSLPMDFFNQRYPGDIINRSFSNESIASTVIMNYAPLILDFCAMIFYFFMIVIYSPILTAIGIISVILNLLLTFFISNRTSNLLRVQMKNDAEFSNAGINGIQMIETIKSSGAETGFFQKWAGLYANLNNSDVMLEKVNSIFGQIPSFLTLITDGLILCLGVWFVIKGDWSIGMVSAFIAYLSNFTSPSTKLINSIQSYKELTTSVERIKDVMEYDKDIEKKIETISNIKYKKLTGKIEIKNITFGYNRYKDPLIKDFTLDINAGDSIAFVGASGSGKSTIARLLTRLNTQWSGKILFDGKKVEDIDKNILVSSIASVDQHISMFPDTIYNNLTMWDKSISEEAVVNASKDAEIYDDIMNCDKGFETMMTEDGKNFSGGQRQRIEIARALAMTPSILIMDEATSSLDAETEKRIIDRIRKKKLTTIMISHRLSTVRDCDLIIVLKNGEELDRGTHKELMKRCSYYAEMISNE